MFDLITSKKINVFCSSRKVAEERAEIEMDIQPEIADQWTCDADFSLNCTMCTHM